MSAPQRSMKERMQRGDPYLADDPELRADHARAQRLLERFNATRHDEQDERDGLLRELLGRVGDAVEAKPTLRCDYGTPITIGAGTFINYDCILLDVAPITIGDNVWLGGGVIVCPGVTIGDDRVVGAGAVVTRDLPAGVLAAGVPARVRTD